MPKNKLGFTLIELLAVIVILAIIALIATPIVLNIIKDSKESATLQSAQFYLDAVETAIAKKIIDDPRFKPSSCEIQADGNLKCDGTLVKVEINGEIPTSGTITLENGKIKNIELVLSKKTVITDDEGNLVYLDLKYKIGDEITFNPGDQERTWNVIGEDNDTVTLMLTEKLGGAVAWNSAGDNSSGPKDVLEYLNSATITWDNVDSIESYSYINNLNGTLKPCGYQKIEIENGITTLTHQDGTTIKLDETNKAKARLLYYEELIEVASKTNKNLKKENLEEYITKNLTEINTTLGITATNVDEVIDGLITQENYNWIQNESEYAQLFHTVETLVLVKKVDQTYDISFPNYLHHSSSEDESFFGYWTLSADASFSNYIWIMFGEDIGSAMMDYFNDYLVVRPVITIPKSKLK